MRWGRVVAVCIVVLASAACGGGNKSNSATTGSSPSSGALSVGSDAAGAAAGQSDAASDAGAADGGAGQAQGDPGQVSSQGGDPAAAIAPVPPGLKPFAGNYTYTLTGQGAPQQIVITLTDLNDTDQRSSSPPSGPTGEQVQVLRYLNDRIQLVSLEMNGALHKKFVGPVLFVPIPANVGSTWAWDLTSEDHLTHVHQASRVNRTETLTVNGQPVDTFVVETDITISGDVNATGHLTSWASLVYKLPVRSHAVLNVTTPTKISSDTTTDLLDLRPS